MKTALYKLTQSIQRHKKLVIPLIGIIVASAVILSLIGCNKTKDAPSSNTAKTSDAFSQTTSTTHILSNITENLSSQIISSKANSSVIQASSNKTSSKTSSKSTASKKTSSNTSSKKASSQSSTSSKCKEHYHLFGDWELVQNSTTTRIGIEKCTCTVCGHVITRNFPKREAKYNCVDKDIIIKREKIGPTMTTRFIYDICIVADKRTWGNPPTITITSTGGLHTVYYDKNNQKVEFTVEPVKDYIHRYTILENGTYATILVGSYS